MRSSLAQSLAEHEDPTYLLSQIFQSTAFILVEEKTLEFRCSCSWERVTRALTLVGTEELSSMLEEQGGASIRCDFCTKDYSLDRDALEKLIESTRSRELKT